MVEAASEAKGLLEADTGATPSRETCNGKKPGRVRASQGTLQGIAGVVHALHSTAAVFGRNSKPSSIGSRLRVDVAYQQEWVDVAREGRIPGAGMPRSMTCARTWR